MLPWIAAALVLAAIIAGVAVWNLKQRPNRVRSCVLNTNCRRASNSAVYCYAALAVSPDGKQFVYSTTKGLYLRSVDELTAKLIPELKGHVNRSSHPTANGSATFLALIGS